MSGGDPIKVTAAHLTGREPPPRPRRVYKTVSIAAEDGRYRLLLDGKPARTPLRLMLETPHQPLAEAVQAEWDAQRETVDPATMPMTRLLATAIDRVQSNRDGVIASLMAHVHADLLCYRADHPAELAARQRAAGQPVLDWMEATHGIAFTAVAGVMPVDQPLAAVEAMRAAIAALNLERLTAFQACAGAAGSLALALALAHGRLTAAQVFAVSMLDETYQAETWGDDPMARERRDSIEKDIAAAGEFLRLTSA